MNYKASLGKLIFSPFDQLFRISKADKVKRIFPLSFLLLLFTVLVYGWMAWLGIGTDILSPMALTVPREEYEAIKLSFLIGRVLYALLFFLFLLFFPSLLYRTFFRVKFSKALLLQLAVLTIFLFERLLWIPLYIYFGLDWYASPFSLGPVLAVLTSSPFWIYTGGTITLFLLWMVWFQVYYLSALTERKKVWIWITVITLHILYVIGAACVSYYTTDILSFFLRSQ